MRLSPITAALAAIASSAAFATQASAADICVENPACPQGGAAQPSLEAALVTAQANAESDRILLGPGTFTAPTTSGFQYSESGPTLELVGAGRAATTLTGPTGAVRGLMLHAPAGSRVSDLRVVLPANAPAGATALDVTTEAERVDVTADPTQVNLVYGIALQGPRELSDFSIEMPPTKSVGLFVHSSAAQGASAVGGSVKAFSAAVVRAPDVTLERVRLRGKTPFDAAKNATVRSSVLHTVGQGGNAAFVQDDSSSPTSVTIEDSTLVGDGSAAQWGLFTWSHYADAGTNVAVRNSVIELGARNLGRDAASGTEANIALSYSSYDPDAVGVDSGPGAITAGDGNVNLDPGFVDASASDFRLSPDSPLIDAGDPAATGGVDLEGNPLVVDGDSDGVARRDIGAYEAAAKPPAPPVDPPAPPADPSAPPTGAPAQPAPPAQPETPRAAPDRVAPLLSALHSRGGRISFRLSEAAAVRFVVQRRAGGRWALARRSLTRAGKPGLNRMKLPLKPGRYRIRALATDAAGNRSRRLSARFRVTSLR